MVYKLPVIKGLYEHILEKRLLAQEQMHAKNQEAWLNLPWDKDQKILHHLQGGIPIYLFKDSVLCRMIFEGCFEVDEMDFVKTHLKEGDIFIDIGSNIGLYALIASKAVGPKGKVIAFEPSPVTFNRLQMNTVQAGFEHLEVRNLGLSHTDSAMKLHITGSGMDAWDSFTVIDPTKVIDTVEVFVSTLDEQLSGVDKSRVSMIKIDVEGWEKFVLLGGENFLKKYSPCLMVEFTQANARAAGHEITEVYDLLVAWGYEWFTYRKGRLRPSSKKQSYPYENLIAQKKQEDNATFLQF